ncbi:hypothetical protein M3Y94_00789900 [Aphelenchoides besseyi]|nr:hypothetical protein M3Y94_00789900 [Aphelenchoides besseyi]KAI6232438.1 hypothetical protein M3Y95_00485900 [Aphelenchoides besseyi]
MARWLFVILTIGEVVNVAAEVNSTLKERFYKELQCRRDVHSGSLLPILIMLPVLFSFIYLIAVAILVFFIRKKLRTNIDMVVEKTHAVMDAVLVALIPKRVLNEIGSHGQEKKKTKKND